jgi:uncharacterized membrane protein
MIVAVLALVGFFISLYLLAYSVGLTGTLMCGVGDCSAVQSSEYARLGPLPVSALGVVGYAVLFLLGLMGVQPRYRDSRLVAGLLLVGASMGFLYSAYLTYLEAAVIGEWCQWCVLSAIVMTLIFLACLPEVRRIGGRT